MKNFAKVLQILIDSFALSSRPETEDIRKTFKKFYDLMGIEEILLSITKFINKEEFRFSLKIVYEGTSVLIIINLIKLFLFYCFSFPEPLEQCQKITNVIFLLGSEICPELSYFRTSRLLHFIYYKNQSIYARVPHVVYSKAIRSAVLKNAVLLIKYNVDEISLPAIESEILSLIRTFYGIGTETIKVEDILSPEKLLDNDNRPYYINYPIKACEYEGNLTVQEIKSIIDIVNHFFFRNFEKNLGAEIYKKLSENSKMKITSPVYITRKIIFSSNIPSKLKRGIFKFFEEVFKIIKKDEKKWFGCRSIWKLIDMPKPLDYL